MACCYTTQILRIFTEQAWIPRCHLSEVRMGNTWHALALWLWKKKFSRSLTDLSSWWICASPSYQNKRHWGKYYERSCVRCENWTWIGESIKTCQANSRNCWIELNWVIKFRNTHTQLISHKENKFLRKQIFTLGLFTINNIISNYRA